MTDNVRYLVGDLVIDVGRGRVTRGDTEIPLPKLSFDLLLVLTRAAPNLLSVDTLIEKVWPGLVVSPETVSQRVKLLRDVLGDDPKAPRYIAGLRGRGYQLIATVEGVPVVVAPVSPLQDSGATVGSPKPTTTAARNPTDPDESTEAGGTARAAASRRLASKRWGIATFVLVSLAIGAYLYKQDSDGMRRSGDVSTPAARGVEAQMASTAFAPPPHSVAVLAFINLSGNAAEEYFSDGLSEELVHALARIRQLRVAARTSSFSFKGSAVDIPTVGRKLNVGAVLEGSVRKSGSRIRITAQLINSRDGYHLWSQIYDRDLSDILEVQSEIATSVARLLEVTLLGNTGKELSVGGTANPLAFEAYLRARHGESIQDERGIRTALESIDRAIQLDPDYANAHAFRGDVLAQLALIWVQDAKERDRLIAEAKASAEKGVAMANQSGYTHGVLGQVLSATTTDYVRIDAEYRRSIELEPGNAGLLLNYASYGALFGRADALAAAQQAIVLDPLSAGAHANLGVVLFYARRHDEARNAFKEAARLGSNRLTINWTGVNELAAGIPQAALPYCERKPDFWYDHWCLGLAYHRLNRQPEAKAMLDKVKAQQGDMAAYQYAEAYAYWGQTELALDWLDTAVKVNDPGLIAIKVDPFLDSLRDTARFKAIVSRLNLPT